jgi:hypothetical protein
VIVVGYSKKRENPNYVLAALACIIFFFGGLIVGTVSVPQENPVCDILNAHVEGLSYGIRAAEDEQEKLLVVMAVGEWKKMAEMLESDKRLADEVYARAKRRNGPLYVSVVLETLELLK